MANYEQLGKPYEFTSATPTLSITDIVGMSWKEGREVQDHFGGAGDYPRVTLGRPTDRLTVRTSNLAMVSALAQGLEVETITAKWQAPASTPAVGAGTVTLQHAKVLTISISCARVVELAEIPGEIEGNPQVFEIQFAPKIKESTGAQPIVTRVLA